MPDQTDAMADTMVHLKDDGATCQLTGKWILTNRQDISVAINTMSLASASIKHIDASAVTALDTYGAMELHTLLVDMFGDKAKSMPMSGLNHIFIKLYQKVMNISEQTPKALVEAKPKDMVVIARIGRIFYNAYAHLINFMIFMGRVMVRGVWFASGRRNWGLANTSAVFEQMGVFAMPIVALLSFLIGVVLCYQMGLQLIAYNANIFIVDLSGLAILREFGPLITAIVAAARTSTAFSSEIGAMKVNQEIDALTTMGISPMARLVMPKVIGLVIALPLLTIWADAFGLFGSMVMSHQLLSINFVDFAQRFRQVTQMSSLWLGVVKAPVFALAISLVGCFQGFQVERGADSVGKMTTKAAVQAIFMIVIIDAGFSILYSMQGW